MSEALQYTIVLRRNELGGYTVEVPALAGCITQGRNLKEATTRAGEAIACHLEGLAEDGLPIPKPG